MAAKISAGLLLYRRAGEGIELLLAHPGGPFYQKKDDGSWSIPKGEAEGEEDLLERARIEFREELGAEPPPGPYLELGIVKQKDEPTINKGGFEAVETDDANFQYGSPIRKTFHAGMPIFVPVVSDLANSNLLFSPTRVVLRWSPSGKPLRIDRITLPSPGQALPTA